MPRHHPLLILTLMATTVSLGGCEGGLFGGSSSGDTGLHRAAMSGTLTEVQDAITAGDDVNARGSSQVTPLHLAARWNADPRIIESLLTAGADVSARTGGGNSDIGLQSTALHLAAGWNGNPDVVRALIEGGASVDARNGRGHVPCDLIVVNLNTSDPMALRNLLCRDE